VSAPDGCWCCGREDIEHETHVEVVTMSADDARAFAMPNAAKVVCVGQADPARYRFGARVYRLFASFEAYQRYLAQRKEAACAGS
jgi:hypothetical protein